ncbi:MAG: alpha/beta fold hydrolase [Roseobacter sp.]
MIWKTRQRSDGAGGLCFFEEGQGLPLVLIHGVGLQAEAWSAVLPHLSPRFRVIAVDMPGHGKSPLQESTTLDAFTDRFAAFIQALDQPIFLAGHSMGALLAVELAAILPDRVRAIIALNTVFRRSQTAAEAVQARAHALICEGAGDPGATLKRWFGTNPDGDVKAASDACRKWLTRPNFKGYAAAYRIFAHYDGPDAAQLARLTCPAFFMTGAEDPNSTPQMSQALATACGGTSQVLQQAAHMLPMTHPQDLSAALMTQFSPNRIAP